MIAATPAAAPPPALQVRELKAQHTLELDAVQTRLRAVLAKKDVLIAQLKARLTAVEQLMQRQQDELAAGPATGEEDVRQEGRHAGGPAGQ